MLNMNRMRIAARALLVLSMSCRDALSPEQRRASELESAHRRWQAQNLHSYAYTIQSSCFCANVDPLYIVVVSDTVAGVFDLKTGTFLEPKWGSTVDVLFTFIQNAIDHHAYLIRAEYDAAKGFPTTIDYDGSAEFVDDEISIRVSDVHPIASLASP